MHFLVTGGTGFIGQAFVKHAIKERHTITILSRGKHESCESIEFVRDLEQIADNHHIDAIVNLAGAPLGDKRWSDSYKTQLIESRLETTRRVIKLCDRLMKRPSVILNASAIGYYGSRGDHILTEDSTAGDNFSSKLCQDWEALSNKLGCQDTRVCNLRFGVVFGRSGGALKQLSQSFRFKIGTQIGAGNQWMSWVHLEDAIRAMTFLVEREGLKGTFNITSPYPTKVGKLSTMIGEKLPVIFHLVIPSELVKLIFGEMGTELLLSSQRVLPNALSEAGFNFAYADLNSALTEALVEA